MVISDSDVRSWRPASLSRVGAGLDAGQDVVRKIGGNIQAQQIQVLVFVKHIQLDQQGKQTGCPLQPCLADDCSGQGLVRALLFKQIERSQDL